MHGREPSNRRHDHARDRPQDDRDDFCRRSARLARLPALRRAARRRWRSAGAARVATSTSRRSPASPGCSPSRTPRSANGAAACTSRCRGSSANDSSSPPRSRARRCGPATRARLESLERATRDHGTRLRALLAPLEIEQHAASYETYLALRTRLPADQGLTTYYANIHRDWCWGDAENDASFEMLAALLRDAPPGSVLVLGAGAGRLAYDLHMRTTAALTVALDFNPLLSIVADTRHARRHARALRIPDRAARRRRAAAHACRRRRRRAPGSFTCSPTRIDRRSAAARSTPS